MSLLRCIPFIAPEEWRGKALGEAVPPLCAHPHPAVREAAGDAMRRAVKALPASRDAVVQGAAATLLRPPGAAQAGISLTDAAVAASALTTLRDVCAVWRGAVADEAERARVEAELTPSKPDAAGTGLGPAASLGTLRPESAGLLLLCSPSPSVRAAAVDMLKEVAALAAALRRSGGVVDAGTAAAGGGGSDEGGKGPGPGSDLDARGAPPSMSAILDACAGDMMWSALGGDERPADAASLGHLTGEAAPGSPSSSSPRADRPPTTTPSGDSAASAASAAATGGPSAVARHTRGGAWTSALGALAARAATASPEVTTTARAQALQRVQATMMQEGARANAANRAVPVRPRAPTDPDSAKFEAWRNCTCFVCAASPTDAEDRASNAENQAVPGTAHPPESAGIPPNPLLATAFPVRTTPLGARGSLASLFALLVPCLREGGAQAAAAASVLARVPPLAAPRLLSALAPLQAALSGGGGASPSSRAAGAVGTPFDRASADRELRAHLARLHLRLASSGAAAYAAPGRGGRDAVAKHLLAFIDGTVEYARGTSAGVESSADELARLQFAAAQCAVVCAPQIAALAPDAATPETRARLWERFREIAERGEAALVAQSGGGADGYGPDASGSAASAHAGFPKGPSGPGSARSLGSFDSAYSRRDSRSPGPGLSAGLSGSGSSFSRRAGAGGGGSIHSPERGAYGSGGFAGSVDRSRLGLPPALEGFSTSAGGFEELASFRGSFFALGGGGGDGDSFSRVSGSRVSGDDRSSAGGRSAGGGVDPTHPAVTVRVAREAMAALLAGPAFDDDARKPKGRVLRWIGDLLSQGRIPGVSARSAAGVARRALRYHLKANPGLAHTVLDACYSPRERTAAAHVSVLAALYADHAERERKTRRLETEEDDEGDDEGDDERRAADPGDVSGPVARPSCSPAKIVALVLYKLVHPSATVRDDAVALLRAATALDLGEMAARSQTAGTHRHARTRSGGSGGPGLAEVLSLGTDALPELPDAYQAFQQNVSRQLARHVPGLGEELLVEALGRQMDEGAADAGAHRHVLAALAPWVAGLHLPHIAAQGRSERLLKALYFVTYFRGDALPREMETLWRHIGKSPRNVVPALRFLEQKGLEDAGSVASMSQYCLAAKRVCLYLARAAPQQSVDQLVYAISLRGLEVDYPPRPERERRSERDADLLSQADFTESEYAGSVVSGASRSNRGDDDASESGERWGAGPDGGDADGDDGLRVTAPDLAIILLAEVAAEHDEDFRVHLPVLLHAVVATLAGSPEPTVRAHCRQLLANLAHALAARPLSFTRTQRRRPIQANPSRPNGSAAGQGWQGEVGRWGDVVPDPGGGGVLPGALDFGHSKIGDAHAYGGDAEGRGFDTFSRGGGGSLSSSSSFPELAAGELAKGRAAVARLQATLARPGAAASSSAGGLVGGVIQRGGFGARATRRRALVPRRHRASRRPPPGRARVRAGFARAVGGRGAAVAVTRGVVPSRRGVRARPRRAARAAGPGIVRRAPRRDVLRGRRRRGRERDARFG